MSPRRSHIFIFFLSATLMAYAFSGCGEDTPLDPDDGDGGGGDPTIDTIPPATISGLLPKYPTTSSMVLQWFAPGDDGDEGQAAMYDIRWATSEITGDNWDSANRVPNAPIPKPVGEVEQFRVYNLPSGQEIHFALKTYDEVLNASGLCPDAVGTTGTEYIAPAEVDDLRAVAINETEFLLTWTAPGDDGYLGTASQYDIRYDRVRLAAFAYSVATEVTGEPAPRPVGQTDSCVVSGLDPDHNYYFALRTADELPTWSKVSNVTSSLGWNNVIMASPSAVDVDLVNGNDPVEIWFRTPEPAGQADIEITWKDYTCGYCTRVLRHLVSGTYEPGAHYVTWDLTNDAGEPPTLWWGEVAVRFYWNGEFVDSTTVRLETL
jgi:hypothetical protein